MEFDPSSDEFFADPHKSYRRLRAESPVYYNSELDFYALTRHADVAQAYRDYSTYSSAHGYDLAMVKSGDVPPNLILLMDPPEHRRMRGLVSRAFTPRAISALRETVASLVEKYLSTADPRRFDVVQDFSAPFPVEVIAHMAGVPTESRQRLRLLAEEIMRHRAGDEVDEAFTTALLEAFAFYHNLVQQRREQPSDDMISTLVGAEMMREGGEVTSLDDLEIASFAMLLGGAGAVTVTKVVSSAVALLAQHPDQWQLLLDDRTKIGGAVEEVLRFDGPVLYNVRYTLKEVTLQGVTIPPGRPVLLCTAAANRDPDAFRDPDIFDIDRDRAGAQHLGLGYGIHSCLGAALGRMESAVALDHLLDFMPNYEVIWEDCVRVNSSNEAGWSHLPVRVLP
ncbi:cytochrome P450 [Mycobacterium sp.]|uniref:cytochrome P450 n=1 Tax=Mycobacterium sp. TaxID=1785 RepID=UPI002DB2E7B9|nr:cytochrome P450 [Mycobacterium sp.]